MCNAASYLASILLIGVTISILTPKAETGLALDVRSVSTRSMSEQIVNRSHKADRLILPTKAIRDVGPSHPAREPVKAPRILPGCESALGPTSISARLNYPTRCLT